MITSIVLNSIFDAVSYLVGLIPSVTVSSPFVSTISTVSGYVSSAYNLLPYITASVLAFLAFDVAFESGYLFYKVIYWIIRRFPTQS
jgi:hypothetical protein